MDIPAFNFVAHASDVVCVSIGANLLLPVAPAIMSRFFSGIEVDPDKIIANNFSEDLQSYLTDDDLKNIGAKAVAISHRQQAGQNNTPGLFWRVLDVCFAAFGVFLLWSGWINDGRVAPWSPVLFLPVLVAAGWPFICYVCSIAGLKRRIFFARSRARFRKWRDRKAESSANDADITAFVDQAKQAISKKNGAGKAK